MASNFTLANAVTFLTDQNLQDSSAKATRLYKKMANEAKVAVHLAAKFDFDKRRGRIVFPAPYSTGTVSVNAGGTTVTGVGTTFTAAMVGGFIRFNGEDLQYEITAFVSATSITIETYRGTANLAAVTYQITFERQALPTRFRDFEKPNISTDWWQLINKPLNMIMNMRLRGQEVSEPYFWATDWIVDSGTTEPSPYIWVYPAPSDQRVLEVTYYVHPAEMTADSDDFAVPNHPTAQSMVREFLKTQLYLEQGKADVYQAQLQIALGMARKCAAMFRASSEGVQREIWSPFNDVGGNWPENRQLAPGEPVFDS